MEKQASITSLMSAFGRAYHEENSPLPLFRDTMAKAGSESMISCFDHAKLEKLLEDHGFLIYELLTDGDVQDRYFRHRDDMTAFPHICYCHAVLQ